MRQLAKVTLIKGIKELDYLKEFELQIGIIFFTNRIVYPVKKNTNPVERGESNVWEAKLYIQNAKQLNLEIIWVARQRFNRNRLD